MMGGGGMHMMPDGGMMKNSAMKKGGMATGGVKMGNAGGYKHGGKSSKKAPPLLKLHCLHNACKLSIESSPPNLLGMM